MRGRPIEEWTYYAAVDGGLRVRACRFHGRANAVTLPRQVASGAHLLPYSCVQGHVTSWILWLDVLADLLGDLDRAARLAGLLEADMSAYLRERREVTIPARQLLAWVSLVDRGDVGAPVV